MATQEDNTSDLELQSVSESESEAEEIHTSGVTEGSSTQQASGSTSNKKKKKKKKSKAKKIFDKLTGNEIPQEIVDRVVEQVKKDGTVASEDINEENVREALEHMKIMDVVKGKAGIGGFNRKDMGEHKFWSTQPVPQPGEGPPEADGYIDPSKPPEEVRQEPYQLPEHFEWSTLDIDDPVQNKEVYDLLSLNYVEDDQAAFRFKYSGEFLAWALKPPGYHKEWHIGVRVSKTKKLVAFISGIPMKLRVRQNTIMVTEINFLCVLKKLRSKRLAPVLIKEVTRRVHLKGIFQAIYTAGVVIPTPVAVCRYYHRSLNIQKLIDTKFSFIPRSSTLARMIRLNKVPENTSLPGLRQMEGKDVDAVTVLFAEYMKRFDMVPLFNAEEARHTFLSGAGRGEVGSGGTGRREGQVTWSYVVEDPSTKKITDFFMFYSLPSTVINNLTYPLLEAAYLFYYATDAGVAPADDQDGKVKKRLTTLIGDALIIANNAKFDVFNALTLMDNAPILQDLKFGPGDGFLNFYLYNWRTSTLAGVNPEGDRPAGRGVGVVML
ncbi:N-myristoyl transferase [Crepidotus variabilis]|uniref:Glycylpeptide N-tetradecanoyltransferase n=1 Tax=Crepidotus variabilis TaxID=179855 RepID=A0A9P6JX06_9AGAR|nr:N-myristoyl transferase [Crepidotus variabilis]